MVDRVTVQTKVNNKTNLKKQFLGRRLTHLSGYPLQQEHSCPAIALSGHEARLHFVTPRAILDDLSSSQKSTAPGVAGGMKRNISFLVYSPFNDAGAASPLSLAY